MDLHDLAEHATVSSADATRLGIDAYGLRTRVASGQLRRLIRGWYAVCPPGVARPPWVGDDVFETERRQHRLLTVALLRSFEGRVVASHQSALVLHGVPLWRADLTTAHLSRTQGDHTRHRRQAVLHPRAPLSPVRTTDGLSTVDVAAACVQVGLYPPHEMTARHPFESLVATDGALHAGLVSPEGLEAAITLCAHHPGIQQVRALLKFADGRHESVGETRLAHVMRLLGLRFTPQVWVTAGGRRWRCDFELEDDPVVVEFDGLVKYSGGARAITPGSVLAGREALVAEKWREDRLRDEGRQVVRFIWSELDDHGLIAQRLDGAIARARRSR
ncbi:MAG: type IV toxin-antitoxin system AbiEi family antitoxin domain-containing protein [Pedococcus sp.]